MTVTLHFAEQGSCFSKVGSCARRFKGLSMLQFEYQLVQSCDKYVVVVVIFKFNYCVCVFDHKTDSDLGKKKQQKKKKNVIIRW